MNRLSQHIEYLLLTHNCVIVPQFGAFVAHTSNAQHADSEDLFFPPKRIVRFNPELTEDDGLLVGVVQAVHRGALADAKRQVQQMILELRQQLLSDGQVDFGSIGIFTQDEDGHVSFSTCQAGIISPEHYGLEAFTMPKLTATERFVKLADQHKQHAEGFVDTDKHIVIRISRRSLRYVAACAAFIAICLLFSAPMSVHRERLLQQASLISTPQPAASVEVKQHEAKLTETSQAAAVAEEPQQVALPAAADQYAIVLASDVSLKNAERYIADLQSRGYANAQIHDNGKLRRVVLAGYADETEAYNANAALHKAGKEFASSWVMKL